MKASVLREAVLACIRAKRASFVWGSPGIGKSALIAAIARELGYEVLDFRLVMRDAVDMRGVPFVENGCTKWAVPAEFPKPGTKGIWLLDELNAAHPQVQVVAYQLTHDRAVGEYKVPDGWHIVCAGNYETDGAVVHKMSSALSSRVVHLDLEVDLDDWLKWAAGAGVSEIVRAFLRFRPELLHKFDKKERAFPCPRTWEIVSDLIKAGLKPEVEHALFEGTIGKAAAVDLSSFVRIWRTLPDIDNIIANPTTARVPDVATELGTVYAVAGALSNRATVKNFGNVVAYLERMPVEFSVFAVQEAVKREPGLQIGKVFTTWCHKHADVTLAGWVEPKKAAA